MSLKLKIQVKESKNSIVINECTGRRSHDNEVGYGLPNYTLAMVTKAQFEIYKPEQIQPLIIPVYPNFPTDDTELGFEILKSQTQSDIIESGVWKVGYRVSGVDQHNLEFEKYTETKSVFIKDAECCVDKLVASTANIPMNVFMKDEKKRIAAELSILLKDAEFAKSCGNFDAAQKILKFINLQCRCCS